jgi:hypothetical protein
MPFVNDEEVEEALGWCRYAFEGGAQAAGRPHDDIKAPELRPIAPVGKTVTCYRNLGLRKVGRDGVSATEDIHPLKLASDLVSHYVARRDSQHTGARSEHRA